MRRGESSFCEISRVRLSVNRRVIELLGLLWEGLLLRMELRDVRRRGREGSRGISEGSVGAPSVVLRVNSLLIVLRLMGLWLLLRIQTIN